MIQTKVINLKLTDEQKKEIENLQSQKYTTKITAPALLTYCLKRFQY